ncbi:MAG: nucleotidyltransferase [Myxococcales bacterium]|nr:nucleotidyltransferase [Myxococcales bacterium]MCB9530185.1 nucleotidyltransferase [Myxococcales bacterium]MCB9533698.1 nucleotidyltransferase [Myxococcales bacterium]
MRLANDLNEFIGLLNSSGAEFVIVGGHAVAYHGYPRFTGDIDVLVRPSRENAQRVVTALRGFGFEVGAAEAEELATPDRMVALGRPPNRIDLLTSISGVDFEDVWRGRIEGDLDGLQVSYIGLPELLANKRASGRQKDAADIEVLTNLRR